MSNPNQFTILGDLNILAGLEASLGPGSLFIAEDLTASGESFLNKTNILTDDGLLNISGTNKVSAVLTGSNGNIELYGSNTSFLRTTTGNLTLRADTGVLALQGASATLVSDTTTVSLTGATGVNITSSANNVVVTAAATLDLEASTSITAVSSGLVSIDGNASSRFTVTGGGNLTLNSITGRVINSSGSSASNAITIAASNAAGGIDMSAGTAGINALATGGPISLNAQNNSSNFSLATNGGGQNLSISLTGTTASSLRLTSAGTIANAVNIIASNVDGGITASAGTSGITNTTTGPLLFDGFGFSSHFTLTTDDDNENLTFSLLGTTASSLVVSSEGTGANAVNIVASTSSGGITASSGTGGFLLDTTGPISLDSAGAASNFTVTGAFDLSHESTLGRLVLKSGKAAVDAVRILANNVSGGIDIDAGSGGITIDTTSGISIDAAAAASNFSLATSGSAQDLTISVTGATDSSLILSSSGTNAADAIIVNASAGGIKVDATNGISINTTNTSTGISIATTTTGVPVTIGTSTSLTTIAGDLIVAGSTTKLNTETIVSVDNVILLNSGIGELGIDAGTIVRRYQTANGSGTGDVVTDTAKVTGAFQAGSATPGTLILSAGDTAIDNFYNGWWIKVTSGTGNNQVRRIKTYVSSSKTATLYVTADNTADLLDGLDLVTAPAAADTYSLYCAPYSASYFDASQKVWVIGNAALVPDAISVGGTSVVKLTEYTHLNTGSIVITGNTGPSDSQLNVNVINEANSDVGVTIEGVLLNNGLINGIVPDSSEIVLLPDNASTLVDVTATATTGSYMVFVVAVQSSSGSGSYLSQTTGANSVFVGSSSGLGGAISRLSTSKGTANQKVNATWDLGQKIQLYHQPSFTGGSGSMIPYRVKVVRVL